MGTLIELFPPEPGCEGCGRRDNPALCIPVTLRGSGERISILLCEACLVSNLHDLRIAVAQADPPPSDP